ncbi:GAF domain-containing protein [soil metagenome]
MDHRFLLVLGDTLRVLRDREDLTAAAAEMLGRHLGVARAGYGEIEGDTDLLDVRRDWGRPDMVSLSGRLRVLDTFGPQLFAVLRGGATLVVRDCCTDIRCNDPRYLENWASVDTRSLIVVPLIRGQTLRAVFWVHEQQPRDWTDDEIHLCEEVAARTWDSLERARAEAALREEEDHYRHTVELNPQVPWTSDPQGTLDHVAPRWLELTGTTGLNGSWAGAIHADDIGRTFERWAHCVSTGNDYDIEHRARMRNGEYYWMRSRAFARRDADGRIIKWYGFTENIDDRRRAEHLLREESRALEAINSTAIALTSQHDLDVIVDKVLETGVGLARAQFGSFFYNTIDDHDEHHWVYAVSGHAPAMVAELLIPSGGGLFAETFHKELIVRSDDLTCDPRCATEIGGLDFAEGERPVRSYLAVPVVSRSGEVLGGIVFGHESRAHFSLHTEQLVAGIAAHAAIAIDNARLLASAQSEVRQRIEAESQLRLLNENLEQRVTQVIAEREQAHDALRQAQKMEAVGQLTGGIAHDFNNLLTGIIGSLDLLDRRVGVGRLDNIGRYTATALASARRAAALTQRLLAFARRQSLDPKPIMLNPMVASIEELIRRTVGEGIHLSTVLSSGSWATRCDVNQLESALLNVCINARDAMPEGGRIVIETSNAELDENYAARERDVVAGQYVLMAISDTGTGMTPEVLVKAFEPFFTTKPIGKGTGLGLSQLYGFIKQSGGHVALSSTPDVGTTVRIYLPRHVGAIEAHPTVPRVPMLQPRPEETVLVVEDEDTVRQLVIDILDDIGYAVSQASEPNSALRILESDAPIDLLVTDVGLPGMNGRQLADRARQLRPGLKVLFITGYAHNAAIGNGTLEEGMQVLTKPFTVDQLAARVEAMIMEPAYSA